MTMRPDPTFHASPKLAMEAPPENFAYTLLLSPDFSKPDALAVIDVKRGSPTFSQIGCDALAIRAATGFTTSSRRRLRADWRTIGLGSRRSSTPAYAILTEQSPGGRRSQHGLAPEPAPRNVN
jgi:hypothetical protein